MGALPLTRPCEGKAPSAPETDARRVSAVDPHVRAAAAGDREAARAILTRLLPRTRNLVRYLVRGDGEAEDLAQDALIAIVRGLGTFRGEGPFESWADRVVVRSTFAALKRRRRESIDRAQAETELRHANLEAKGTSSDDYAVRRRAVALLDALPEEQRHAMVMHHVLEMSIPEIAAEVGAPSETVRSRLRLARDRLRELGLGPVTEEDPDDAE
jgi:RNA polymerase sigma-70 factor (ECF subfamily)